MFAGMDALIEELEEQKKAAARVKSKSKMEGIGEIIGILLRGLTPLIWLGTVLWAVWILSGNHPHYLH
jgi:hypothetical protein